VNKSINPKRYSRPIIFI